MQRCSRCVLPESIPRINFDQNGICNYCTNHKAVSPRGEEELLKLFDRAREQKHEYDCLLALSGGRDSSYALWLLSRVYKLKVLTVHFRSPFAHPDLFKLVTQMTDMLDVPLITIDRTAQLHKQCFRSNIQAFFTKPRPAMLSMMCIGCKLARKDILRVAKENKTPLLIGGRNPYENTAFKRVFHGASPDLSSGLRLYQKRLQTAIKELLINHRYINLSTARATIQAFLSLDENSPVMKLLYRRAGVTQADLFYYLPWDEKTVLSTIQKELGWKKPEDEVSSWRFDCRIGRIKDFLYLTLFGFTEKDDLFSKMIRDGLITRDEALQRLEKENIVSLEAVDDCLSVCDLDIETLFSLNDSLWSQYRMRRVTGV